MNHTQQKPYHYFIACCYGWTANSNCLKALSEAANTFGLGGTYSVWIVPGDISITYDIKFYTPQVEGAKFVGTCQRVKQGFDWDFSNLLG